MPHETMVAVIPCVDRAEALVFERSCWGDGEDLYEFAILDKYIGMREYQGFLGRFRRAWRSFWDKPICNASIVVEDPERARVFLRECLAIIDSNLGGNGDDTVCAAEQAE